MKKIYKLILFAVHCALLIVPCTWLFAQNPIPAKSQAQAIVISNATIHIGNGQVLNNASIRFENGLITAIGANVDKNGAEEINVNGQQVYPGLILPSTSLGITEVGALRQTHDYTETGDFNPNVRALVAYNTDSQIIPTLRSNGVLLAQSTPRGGFVSGTSSIMELEGWNWEDAAHTIDDGVHINWIPMFTRGGFFSENPGKIEKNTKRNEALQSLETIMQECKAYLENPNPKQKNLKFEAMRGIFEGKKTIYVHVSFSKEIVEAVQFFQKYQIKKIAVIGGEDAFAVAEFLKDNQIPVILARLHRLPERTDEGVWHPYQLPALLQKAGVLVSLAYDESANDPMGTRNLAFLAGTASAYGLDKEEALKMVTSNTAKILGIDAKVGTLEVGKQATLVISKGDLLDMRSSQVSQAFIQGKKIDLDDKHKQLYRRFKSKYEKN